MLITRPEESYRLCCVVVCDLETSRMGAPYIYDISHLRVKITNPLFFQVDIEILSLENDNVTFILDFRLPPRFKGDLCSSGKLRIDVAVITRPLKMGPIGCREMSITNYESTLNEVIPLCLTIIKVYNYQSTQLFIAVI